MTDEAEAQAIQYEDTFSQTIVVNCALVIVVLVIFGIVKAIFPSVFMPLVQTNRSHWIRQIVAMPLSTYVQRGNFAVFFAVFQSLLIQLFLMILPLICCILIPVYYFGGSQEVNPKTFWSRIQITMVEDGSIFCLVPVLMCLMLSILLMKFYKEF